MPQLQPNSPDALALSALTLDASTRWLEEDAGYALGCECADPRLQIERWDDTQSPAAELG